MLKQSLIPVFDAARCRLAHGISRARSVSVRPHACTQSGQFLGAGSAGGDVRSRPCLVFPPSCFYAFRRPLRHYFSDARSTSPTLKLSSAPRTRTSSCFSTVFFGFQPRRLIFEAARRLACSAVRGTMERTVAAHVDETDEEYEYVQDL